MARYLVLEPTLVSVSPMGEFGRHWKVWRGNMTFLMEVRYVKKEKAERPRVEFSFSSSACLEK